MTLTENLDTFLADFWVTVTAGAVSGSGLVDMPDQLIGGGVAVSTEYSVLVKFADFGGLEYSDAITVDGTPYTVREVHKIDDGKFCRITLTKV